MHIGNSETTDADFNRASKVVSAVFIGFIAIYGIVRWFFNVLGGLYMFKRMVLATILAGTYLDHWMLIPLIGMELVFIILRLVIEAPEKRAYTGMIWVEAALHIVVYVLGYIVLNVAVNAIIMSIIIFLTIVVLSYGLTDLYLESRN